MFELNFWLRGGAIIYSNGSTIFFVDIIIYKTSLKSLKIPKSPKGDFAKLLIFSTSPFRVRGKKD